VALVAVLFIFALIWIIENKILIFIPLASNEKNNNLHKVTMPNEIINYDFIQLEIDKNYVIKSFSDVLEEQNVDLNYFNNLDENGKVEFLEYLSIVTEDAVKIISFEKLSNNQKKEYLDTFSQKKELDSIIKYTEVRFRRIFENFIKNNWEDIPQLIKEINFLNEISNNKFLIYSEELKMSLNNFLEIGKEETLLKIEVFKFLNELLGSFEDHVGIIFSVDSKIFRLRSCRILVPKTFNRLKDISHTALRAKIEENEIELNGRKYKDYSFQKRIIKFNIDKDLNLNHGNYRVNVIKDATLIKEYLVPFCEKSTQFLLNKNEGAIYGTSFSMEYLRLAKAFFTLKDFKNCIYWIDEFLMILEKVELESEFPDIQLLGFTTLKNKCLQKLEVEERLQLKQKQKNEIQPINYKSFEKARDFARNLRLKGDSEWRNYCRSGNKPNDIPGSPGHTYKEKGWLGIRDWLGNEPLEKIDYRSFNDAKKHVNALKLESSTYWRNYCKSGNKPKDIPSNPQNTYENNGWVDWGDWLGTGINKFNNNPAFKEFEEARVFVRNLDLKSVADWREYKKTSAKPLNIPSNPDRVYKNKGWVNWGDWLGTY